VSEIEYFYAAHSAYAYLGSARLMAIAKKTGRTIKHRPIDLRATVPAAGSTPTSERTKEHRAYFFGREIKRWSEERNAPVVDGLPTYHHHDIGLPNRMLIAGIIQGANIDLLAHGMLEAHWKDDADLADRPTLERIALANGYDATPLLAASDSAQAQAIYEANTAEAIERCVFGSPTYFVDGDMFYGQDRLEMVERAIERPYR
jgi:2-hydroxychromene-2-carboxylate isomerase